jgi:hypothetical protein
LDNRYRKFQLDTLPYDEVHVALKPQIAKLFFTSLLNNYSIEKLCEEAEVWPVTFKKWIKNAGNSDYPPFLRLDKLRRLINLLGSDEIAFFSNIEEEVLAIKGYGGSGILWNPHLPIVEDANLVRVVVHLIGDGYVPKDRATTRVPSYSNSNDFLRAQFVECLSSTLGDVSKCIREYVDKSIHQRSYIAFAQWIGYVIRHLYPDANFDETQGSLPNAFLHLPFELKTVIVQTFGDDDGHVGSHSIRFTSGGSMILEQMRGLILQLMEATLPPNKYEELLQSVGEVKPFRSWFILDVYRPLFAWYAEYIGFTHPERAERLEFQLECDRAWRERGLDGFDLDFLTLVGLREVGAVADVARQFMLREDFLFKVFQRLRKLGWIEGVEKRKFTTFFQTAPAGVVFLERTLDGAWGEMDRVVVRNGWWQRLRDELLQCFGTAAEVARVVGMPETTVRGYLQGRRQWMHGKWVVALAEALGWGEDVVSEGVVVAFSKKLAPRYEQCDFLAKDLGVYRRFSLDEISFDDWLVKRRGEVVREEQLLDTEFAEKLESASAIRERIIELAQGRGGEIALSELKEDAVLQTLVANRYSAYLADRMAKLIKQGVFVRLTKGRYRLVQQVL